MWEESLVEYLAEVKIHHLDYSDAASSLLDCEVDRILLDALKKQRHKL